MFGRPPQDNSSCDQNRPDPKRRRDACYAPSEEQHTYSHGSTGLTARLTVPVVTKTSPNGPDNQGGLPISDAGSKFLYTDPLVVHVGQLSKRFMIHKNLACRDSSFFKAACKSGFREAESKEVKLPEDEPETFDNFVQWLYTGDFEKPKSESSYPDWEFFFNTYVLADKLGAPKFGNYIMNVMINEAETRWNEELSLPDAAAVCVAYENTPESSPLRRFLVDLYCYNNKLEIPKHAVPDEFVMEMAFSLKRRSVESGVNRKLLSYYWRRYDLELPERYSCKREPAIGPSFR